MRDTLLGDRSISRKYNHWNKTTGYYENPSVFTHSYRTESNVLESLPAIDTKAEGVHGDKNSYLLQSIHINTLQRERNRSQVVVHKPLSSNGDDGNDFDEMRNNSNSNTTLGKSSSSNLLPSLTRTSTFTKYFVDPKRWKQKLNSIDIELWQAAFDEYSSIPDRLTRGTMAFTFSSNNLETMIHYDNIERLVRNCLGLDVPLFILDKFRKLGKMKCVERFISWSDFRFVINQVMELVESELTKKTEVPLLIKIMNKGEIIDKEMGPLGDMTTVYKDTVSFTASQLKKTVNESNSHGNHHDGDSNNINIDTKSRTLPRTAADFFLSSIPMDPTTSVLSAGTTKGTFQLPGYTGHIPVNKRNDRKVEHSFALNPRPSTENLLLTYRNIGCISGYTGHVSSNAPMFKERTTACDPVTTNGAAYGEKRRIL